MGSHHVNQCHITINDAIVREIKKCKFLVADFTQHKHGVYFESGLGLQRPVIKQSGIRESIV